MNFLELPREIRNLILEFLLYGDDAPEPTTLYVRKWNTLTDQNDPTATKIFCSSLPIKQNALGQLSLVNRQLHREAKTALAHGQRPLLGTPSLKLDLLLNGLTNYYATWLRVSPFTGPAVQTVHVQIRPFYVVLYTRDMFLPPATGPPRAVTEASRAALWRLGAVINAVLGRGPTRMGNSAPQAKARVFTIERLVLEVIRPQLHDGMRDEIDIECAQIATRESEELEMCMVSNIEGFLTSREGGISHVPWGRLLLSRVRKLEVNVEGKLAKTIDIVAHARQLDVPILQLT